MNEKVNKFNIIADQIPDPQPIRNDTTLTGDDIRQMIRDNISTYLKFDADALIEGTDAHYFGGAVRDSIARQDIHDVDIMALPNSCKTISTRLENLGFARTNYSNADIIQLYSGLHQINEPITFIKNNVIVQLIRPAIGFHADGEVENYEQKFQWLLGQVDISACGVSYTQHQTVCEHCDNAITHCMNRVFVVHENHMFHQATRIQHRIAKFLGRGWKDITEKKEETNWKDWDNTDNADDRSNSLGGVTAKEAEERLRMMMRAIGTRATEF